MSKTLAQHVVELLKAYLTIAVSVQLGKERIHVTLAAFKANTPDASPEFITADVSAAVSVPLTEEVHHTRA